MTKLSDYDVQAQVWAEKWGVRMTATFTGHRKYFADDTDTRDVYQVELVRLYKRGEEWITRRMAFDFGASLNDSQESASSDGKYWKSPNRIKPNTPMSKYPNRRRVPPSLYSILACIEKYEPGTFEQWCGDFGADTDSRKALETYLSVQKQYANFARLCDGDAEMMDEAQQIQ
jgi:hypothetical protein